MVFGGTQDRFLKIDELNDQHHRQSQREQGPEKARSGEQRRRAARDQADHQGPCDGAQAVNSSIIVPSIVPITTVSVTALKVYAAGFLSVHGVPPPLPARGCSVGFGAAALDLGAVLLAVQPFALARLGDLGWRRTGLGVAACRTMSTNRARASARLLSCSRKRWAVMISTPSRVSRPPRNRAWRAVSVRLGEARTSKRNCTALDTLLTFWPPGPELRIKLSSSSPSGMTMRGVTNRLMS